MSKKVKLQIHSEQAKIFNYYDCGTEGDLYDAISEIVSNGADEWDIKNVVAEDFQEATYVHCVVPTIDEEEDGNICVHVTDENGLDFEEDLPTHYAYHINGDPRNWKLSDSIPESMATAVKNYADAYPQILDAMIKDGIDIEDPDEMDSNLSDYDSDALAEVCCSDKFEVSTEMFKDGSYVIAEEMDLDGTINLETEIELADDEEFDPEKLEILMWDNDSAYNELEGFCNCVLSIIKYDNTLYRLTPDEWDGDLELYYKVGHLNGGWMRDASNE